MDKHKHNCLPLAPILLFTTIENKFVFYVHHCLLKSSLHTLFLFLGRAPRMNLTSCLLFGQIWQRPLEGSYVKWRIFQLHCLIIFYSSLYTPNGPFNVQKTFSNVSDEINGKNVWNYFLQKWNQHHIPKRYKRTYYVINYEWFNLLFTHK